ncbi:hypothetical protein [Thioalkalivibrio sp. XN279]|uniref:hypothetical protein n=1 Tax=Thioalkalivibrio sp. XN279 TaxID=2714953 RepID=UPI00140B221A|nr:hypothetical protein [Thioalkalivibrio sp. XN279]NHA14441.1 hypothetical protein [Thioalkalivibrio sp. XN279]
MWPFSRSRDRKNKSAGRSDSAPAKKPPRFDAVEVVPSDYGACNAARELAGQRFLSNRMPKLPLPECDKSQCECGYRHHKDRRTEVRRVADMDGSVLQLADNEQDRRDSARRGRRRTDNTPA